MIRSPPWRRQRDVDVVVVGAGLAGLAAARALVAAGASCRGARGARPRRRAHAQRGPRRRQGRRDRRPVGRPHARTACTSSRPSSGSRPSPPSSTARTCSSWTGRLRPLLGHDPEAQPALAAGDRARPGGSSTRASAQGPARRALGGARAPRSSTARRSAPGWTARCTPGAARRMVEIAARTVWGADSGDISLLFALWYVRSARRLQLADRRRGRRPAGPLRRRLAADLAADGRGRWATGVDARRARCAGRAGTARAWSWSRRAAAGGGAARDRRDGAGALRRGSSSSPGSRPARTQLAQRMPWGSYIKCIGGLRRALLARRRAQRRGRVGRRPRDDDLRQHARPTARPECCWRSSAAPRLATLQRLGAAERRDAVLAGLARLYGPRAREAGALDRAGLGARALHRRRPGLLHAPGRVRPATAAPCASRSARSTGRAPRPPRSGRATWTARCARASARPPRPLRPASSSSAGRTRNSFTLPLIPFSARSPANE